MVKRKYNFFKIKGKNIPKQEKSEKIGTPKKNKTKDPKDEIEKKMANMIEEPVIEKEIISDILKEEEPVIPADIVEIADENIHRAFTESGEEILNINEVISFLVGNKVLALDILLVKEIVIVEKLNEVSNAEDYIEGLYNYRGDIIPVINLAKKFNIARENAQNIGIVCQYENQLMCVLTEKVIDVLELDKIKIYEPPALITGVNDYLYKVIKIIDKNKDERIVSVLNFHNIFSNEEQDMIRHIIE
ncbi:chemotaxis protein CheW [bacterium]|nr:chemotaxis protein CheW [bacterium]